jgi:DNA/RNA-binding domain of Phe-tRNA-synthetase-like protein
MTTFISSSAKAARTFPPPCGLFIFSDMPDAPPPPPAFTTASVAPEVAAMGVTCAFVRATGLRNRASDDAFDREADDSVEALLRTLTPEVLDQDPVLVGYRRLHERVGVGGRKNLASPEALLRLLIKRSQLPRVNLLVDVYNLVSVETRLSMGAHDLAHVTGDVVLRLTDGSEHFHPLGAAAGEPVRPGEYAYVDGANEVLCRLDVRQSNRTKLGVDTTDCLFIVQGNEATSAEVLRQGTERLLERIGRFCGGTRQVLSAP